MRANTLGAKRDFKKEIVTIEGIEYEVRQPTLRERSDLRKRCSSISGETMKFDIFEFLIWAVIGFTYVPNTDEKVFEETDYDALSDLPAGGWFDELSEVASKLTNVDSKKPSGDSGKTPSVEVS